MTDQKQLSDRRRDIPTQDQVSTLIWDQDMGRRLSLVRMKLLMEQKELGEKLGITQAMVSRVEIGHLKVSEKMTVEALKATLGVHYSFVAFGTNPERYKAETIQKVYWDTRLRVRRKNRSAYSRMRL